jgi:hypothetical protein
MPERRLTTNTFWPDFLISRVKLVGGHRVGKTDCSSFVSWSVSLALALRKR